MIRKAVIAFFVFLAGLVMIATLAGFPPAYIVSAPGVATGIGSKLLCSARYVSGFSREQAFDDLVQYSPILDQLSIEYDEDRKSVTTSLFGLSKKTASYRQGLGCSVEYSGYGQAVEVPFQPSVSSPQEWPAGNIVGEPDTVLTQLLADMVAKDNQAGLNTRALLVVRNGRILAEAYDQESDAFTPLLGWSMAKSMVSTMLANLEYRGLLNIDEPPGFSTWENDPRAEITVTDMLTMSDGLGFSEEYNPGDDATAMLFTSASASDYVLGKELQQQPGTVFNYSSGTANLLARLHTDILGGPQAAYDDYWENIHQALSFQNAVFETDASGVMVGSSYLYASARDWARLGQLMLNRGVINGSRVFRDDWIERATAANSSGNEKAYGFQWWLNKGDDNLRWPDLPEGSYMANGNRQQMLMVIPSANVLIVRLGWTAGSYPLNKLFGEILREVL